VVRNVLSAGVVVVRLADDGPRYLLLRVYRYWDFPKGEVAADEDPLATARREVWSKSFDYGLSNLTPVDRSIAREMGAHVEAQVTRAQDELSEL